MALEMLRGSSPCLCAGRGGGERAAAESVEGGATAPSPCVAGNGEATRG